MKAKIPVRTLYDLEPDSLAEVKGKTLSQTLVDVEGEALVNVLVDTLPGVEFKTHSNTVGEEEAKAEVETLFDTQAKWRPRHLVTNCAKWRSTPASGDAGPHRLPHIDRCVKSKPLPTRWLTCNQELRPRHLQTHWSMLRPRHCLKRFACGDLPSH